MTSRIRLVPITLKTSSILACFVLIHAISGDIVQASSSVKGSAAVPAKSQDTNTTSNEIDKTISLIPNVRTGHNEQEICQSEDKKNVSICKNSKIKIESKDDTAGVAKAKTSVNDKIKSESVSDVPTPRLEIVVLGSSTSIGIGNEISLTCNIQPESEGQKVWWVKNETNDAVISTNSNSNSSATIVVKMRDENDAGNYICTGITKNGTILGNSTEITLIPEPGKIVGEYGDRVKVNDSGILTCQFEGFPLSNFLWTKIGHLENSEKLKDLTKVSKKNGTHVTMTLNFENVTRKDNGTYECSANDFNNKIISSQCDLVAADVPEVKMNFTKAVGSSRAYLNWTVENWNDTVKNYFIELLKDGTSEWQKYPAEIGGNNSSCVVEGLEKSTIYQFRISANNSIGTSSASVYSESVKTLEKDPEFKVTDLILETIDTDEKSIMISWKTEPQEGLREYVQYYKIEATYGDKTETYTCPVEVKNIYEFHNLEAEPNSYRFRIATYSKYTKEHGRWSESTGGKEKKNIVVSRGTVIGYPSIYVFIHCVFFTLILSTVNYFPELE